MELVHLDSGGVVVLSRVQVLPDLIILVKRISKNLGVTVVVLDYLHPPVSRIVLVPVVYSVWIGIIFSILIFLNGNFGTTYFVFGILIGGIHPVLLVLIGRVKLAIYPRNIVNVGILVETICNLEETIFLKGFFCNH